jgi:hemerythrin-like metal-binding protein
MNISLRVPLADAPPVFDRFVWDEVRATGIGSFDHDHHIISLSLGVLETSLLYGALPGVLLKTVQFIADHSRLHFLREELVMERLGYENMKVHSSAHDEMREIIANEFSMLEMRPLASRHELLARLHDWWATHTATHDAEYSNYLIPRAHEIRSVISEHNLNWM